MEIDYPNGGKAFSLNTEEDLSVLLKSVPPMDNEYLAKGQAYMDGLMKPPKSLGRLEDIAAKVYAIRKGDMSPFSKRCVLIFSADNGVVAEGVASAPQETTVLMTKSFTKGITGVCALAKAYNTELRIVDIGMKNPVNHPMVKDLNVMRGTNNFVQDKAMNRAQCIQAIINGIYSVYEAAKEHYSLLGIGEMGIGNTTTAAAVLSALTGRPASETSGKGAGLDNEAYEKKVRIIDQAVAKHIGNDSDVADIIGAVGGLDIAAMAGAYIGAAFYGIPVVADGFISTVAALCAVRLCPNVGDYLFLSHASYEKGYQLAAGAIGLSPCLDLNMRLGEGSGCPIMFSVMDGALAIYQHMGTFEAGNISREYVDKVQDETSFQVER